ncbi:hypothetical protein ACL655_14775 [Klebsiella quasipneumoniae subsp. similipneumoniae]
MTVLRASSVTPLTSSSPDSRLAAGRLLIEALQILPANGRFLQQIHIKVALGVQGALCPPSRMERLTTVTV